MRFQRGQSVVEFALVLPLFLVLFFGIFYVGMIFADYMTLSDIARSSAREATMSDVDSSDHYRAVRIKYSDVKLPLDVLKWDITTDHFKITDNKTNQSVQVSINTSLNDEGSSIAHIFYNLIKYTGKDINLNITYSMYKKY